MLCHISICGINVADIGVVRDGQVIMVSIVPIKVRGVSASTIHAIAFIHGLVPTLVIIQVSHVIIVFIQAFIIFIVVIF